MSTASESPRSEEDAHAMPPPPPPPANPQNPSDLPPLPLPLGASADATPGPKAPAVPALTTPPPSTSTARRAAPSTARRRRGGQGRRKIKIEYIPVKSKRQITFSKRKSGLMKKAYELSTLTGAQIVCLITSETGHVYTFATNKFQPLISCQEGKNLIQNLLSAPDPEEVADAVGEGGNGTQSANIQQEASRMRFQQCVCDLQRHLEMQQMAERERIFREMHQRREYYGPPPGFVQPPGHPDDPQAYQYPVGPYYGHPMHPHMPQQQMAADRPIGPVDPPSIPLPQPESESRPQTVVEVGVSETARADASVADSEQDRARTPDQVDFRPTRILTRSQRRKMEMLERSRGDSN